MCKPCIGVVFAQPERVCLTPVAAGLITAVLSRAVSGRVRACAADAWAPAERVERGGWALGLTLAVPGRIDGRDVESP